MLALALALGTSISWGIADFIGGVQAKKYAVLIVLLGSSSGGMLLAAVMLAVSGQDMPPTQDLALGALAGVLGLIALAAFYRALAIGTMSIVAPISASGTAIPVAVGIADGDPVGLLTATGFLLTIGGVMLASREPREEGVEQSEDHRTSVLLAGVAAIGFGCIFVLIERASHDSELWPVLSLKVTSLVVVAIVLALLSLSGRSYEPWPVGMLWLAPMAAGFLDVTANVMYAYATANGALSVVAVLASMFPVVTVLLAHRVLGERIVRMQKLGVALALSGVVVLALA
ncbi:MAG: DMT family transporter [Solirubrobacterales bacterium]